MPSMTIDTHGFTDSFRLDDDNNVIVLMDDVEDVWVPYTGAFAVAADEIRAVLIAMRALEPVGR